eukprot:scaffold2799_cov408-Prasinococcus_capsulatus_cf.AAC.11
MEGVGHQGVRVYPVRPGETLKDILSKRKIGMKEFLAINPGYDEARALKGGEEIFLPAGYFSEREREVLKGIVPDELLYPHNADVKATAPKPRLRSQLAFGGTKVRPYTVRKGDTLFAISTKRGVPIDTVRRYSQTAPQRRYRCSRSDI